MRANRPVQSAQVVGRRTGPHVQFVGADLGVVVSVDGSQRNFQVFVGDEDLTTEGLRGLDA
jgi:hypothetical protein